MSRKHLLARATALALLAIGSSAHAQSTEAGADDAWQWNLITYVWASDIKSDASFRGNPVSAEVDFADIIDKADLAQQIHVEGQGRDWGVMTDLTYLSLSAKEDFPALEAETELTTVMLDAAAVWAPGERPHEGVELFGGVRYLSLEMDAKFTPTDPLLPVQRRGLDNSFTDALVGVRYGAPINDKWSYNLRADASFGQTDGTWSVTAAVQRRVKLGRVFLGYRHYVIDLTSEDDIEVQHTMSGPLVAFQLDFKKKH